MASETPEPFVLPPQGIIAFILGNKHVFRRFVAATLVVAATILVLALALRIAGIHLDGVVTVGVTGAATVLGIVTRAYAGRHVGTKAETAPESASGDRAPS